MSTNSISDIYRKIINSIASASTRKVDSSGTGSTTSDKVNCTQTDKLDLNSSLSNLTGYLNYSASGTYNTPSLANYLDTDQNQDNSLNILGEDKNSVPNLTDFLNSAESSDSLSSDSNDGMFDSLIQETTANNNLIIQKALEKINSAAKTSDTQNTDSRNSDDNSLKIK